MSQITRYHEGWIIVPRALPDAVDSLFNVIDEGMDDWALDEREQAALRPFCSRGVGPILMDASVVSDARNMLDGYLLGAECESEHVPELGEQTPIGETCDFCVWCQTFVLRDWCDWLLDSCGYLPWNGWLKTDWSESELPAVEYDRIWSVVTEQSAPLVGALCFVGIVAVLLNAWWHR